MAAARTRGARGVRIVPARPRRDSGAEGLRRPSAQVKRVILPFFVYGTLRPGGTNHDLFLRGRTRHEEPARLRGAVLYEGPGYPYAVEEPGGAVTGELVTALPEAYEGLLAGLDRLEQYVPGIPGTSTNGWRGRSSGARTVRRSARGCTSPRPPSPRGCGSGEADRGRGMAGARG
ncbi:hypothetical protein SHKM778_76700 [Streptomyces sp. KM77-8]|uniref:Gamma-glutamylcyclotransferase AIG2-like domain-containing protein n=1 Tax=Streptomyces haneummycinicus TaxID=3074435 RepID=A0AAT9HVM2_9ACTN